MANNTAVRYRIQAVEDRKTRGDFHAVPQRIYRDDPQWACPLEMEVENVFTPSKNPYFQHGEAIRWVIYDGQGPAGRIGAFYHREKALHFEQPTGGTGFFECINDPEAAALLFDTARDWLAGKGMKAMDGPINFGENDSYWGLLVESENYPTFGLPYHPTYYRALFEGYGFREYFSQESRDIDLQQGFPERMAKISQWIASKEGVEFRHASKKDPWAFAKAMQEVYNEAWQNHEHFSPMTDEQVARMVKTFRPVIIDVFIPYALVKGEPAAFIVTLPDLNEIFRPLKGKFPLWQQLLFLWRSRNRFEWYRKRGILKSGRVVIIGAKSKFQRMGLESGMIFSSFETAKSLGFSRLELSWVGDFNPRMLSVQKAVGSVFSNRHITFRYLFDRPGESQRAQRIDRDAGRQKE